MSWVVRAIAIIAFLGITTNGALAACTSGPDYCQDDARVPGALAAKVKALKNAGYPDRLVNLIKVGDQCVARISTSPDIFTMLLVESDDVKQTFPWSAEDEKRAKDQVIAGDLARYWIFNLRNAFSCDKEKPYDQRPDYDATDDVSKSIAIKCVPSGGAVSCSP